MAMERYTETKKIQFSCTAILYYIVLYNINADMNLKVKRKVLSTLLNIMYAHRHDTVVVRNGCLTLSRFELPHDVVIHNKYQVSQRVLDGNLAKNLKISRIAKKFVKVCFYSS